MPDEELHGVLWLTFYIGRDPTRNQQDPSKSAASIVYASSGQVDILDIVENVVL